MKEPRRLEADEAQLAAVAERLERRSLEPGDYALLKVVIDTVCFLSRQVRQKATSIQRLLRMIFGARTEKTRAVLNRGVTAQPVTETPGEKPRAVSAAEKCVKSDWFKNRQPSDGCGRAGVTREDQVGDCSFMR